MNQILHGKRLHQTSYETYLCPDRDMDRRVSSEYWITHQTLTETNICKVGWLLVYWHLSSYPIPQITRYDCIAQIFQRDNKTTPTHIIVYNDNDEQAVRFENDDNEWNITDQGEKKLMCYPLTNATVGESGFILKDLTRSGSTVKSFSVEFFASSFTAELWTEIHTFKELQLASTSENGCCNRWNLDSKSLFTSIQGTHKTDNQLFRFLVSETNQMLQPTNEHPLRYHLDQVILWDNGKRTRWCKGEKRLSVLVPRLVAYEEYPSSTQT